MPTEAIVCPTCGAHDTSLADAQGLHTCAYCNVRYRVSGGFATRLGPVATVQPRSGPSVALLIALIAVVVLMGAGAAFFLGLSGSDDSESSAVASASPPSVSLPALAAPVAVQVPAPEPVAPESPATATFVFDGTRPGYQSSFYALGWVTNTSQFVIDRPAINAVLLDAAGTEVGVHKGFAESDALGPGERAPVSILIKDPGPHESLQFEVVPRRATYVAERVEGLRLEPSAPKRASFGSGWDIAGKVVHDGQVGAKFVKILILGLDEDDKLLGVHFTYADAETLQPGQSARWSSPSVMLGSKPAKFEYVVSAMVAD
jgi:hypothetical protein